MITDELIQLDEATAVLEATPAVLRALLANLPTAWLDFREDAEGPEEGKDVQDQHHKFLACAIAALIILSLSTSAVFSQQPGGGVSGGRADVQTLAGDTYNYDLLQQTVARWADGRGDVILERTLQNLDTPDWDNTVWFFTWYPDNFSLIRAWDDLGPLAYSTAQSGPRFNVTVHFRRPVQPGQSYHFFLAITIRNMASVSGSSVRANWYTYPGSPVHEFIQGVTFPSNSTFQSISPPPSTRYLSYLEWRASDTPANWQQGYDAGNLVIQAALPRYTTQNNVSLYFKGSLAGRNDTVLDDYLASGNPVIVGVNLRTDSLGRTYPMHYAIVTGKTTVNGHTTYAINDPIYGATTLYEKWNNAYAGMTLFSGTQADRRSLRLSAHSPVELLVTDPSGRKSGYDPATGTFWNDIPDAAYVVNAIAADANPDQGLFLEAKVLLVNNALDGRYSVSVLGTGQGPFEVNMMASDWTGHLSRQVSDGTAQAGSVYSERVYYSSSTGVNRPIYFPRAGK